MKAEKEEVGDGERDTGVFRLVTLFVFSNEQKTVKSTPVCFFIFSSRLRFSFGGCEEEKALLVGLLFCFFGG